MHAEVISSRKVGRAAESPWLRCVTSGLIMDRSSIGKDAGLSSRREGFNSPTVYYASLAQLVERHSCKVDVVGSTPAGGSIDRTYVDWYVHLIFPG